jgi:hypothetical protein
MPPPRKKSALSAEGGNQNDPAGGKINSNGDADATRSVTTSDSDADDDDAHSEPLLGQGKTRHDPEELKRLEQYWGTSIPGEGGGSPSGNGGAEVPRLSLPRSRLAEAIGVDEVPDGINVYRGDRLNPDGSIATPSRPPKRKHVRICDAPDTDTTKLPPPPPLPPMSADEAAAVLGLRARGMPPPPPRACDLHKGAAPPPPPPPDEADEFEGLQSPFDAKLSLIELSGAVEACAEIAGVTGASVAAVVDCATRTARRRFYDRPPATRQALAALIGGCIIAAAPVLKPARAPEIESITDADAQTALVQLAAERRQPPLAVYLSAVDHALRCRISDCAADMDAPLSAEEVALAIRGLLAQHRTEQRPTAEWSPRRGVDLAAALASGGASAEAANSADAEPFEGSRLLRPVSLQQAPLPFSPEAEKGNALFSRTAAAVESVGGGTREASRDHHSASSSSPERNAASSLSPSPVRAFNNPYRTVPFDSALPPSRCETENAGRAVNIVSSLIEQRYDDERRELRDKLKQERLAAEQERQLRERAREERRKEREGRIARLTAARIARDRADRQRLGPRFNSSSDSDDFAKYI